MPNITVDQIIIDAQRMATRVKELDALGSALMVEAEGNNRLVENLRQFQDDIDSLNRVTNNKSNADMVNRIQQQNANSSEILKENRELKICIEDYERAMELIMQKYREHANSKVLETKINFKEVYNERLWKIIREQREKINEMAAVMQRAAAIDDNTINGEVEIMSRLRLENKTLRELLQISKQFGSANHPIQFNEHLLEEKGVQTETDDSTDDLSLSAASIENVNNNSVIQLHTAFIVTSTTTATTAAAAATTTATATSTPTGLNTAIFSPDNTPKSPIVSGVNNNGPSAIVAPLNLNQQQNEDNNENGTVDAFTSKSSTTSSATVSAT